MSTNVFVLDRKKQPRNPLHPSIARQLLRDGKAAIYRRFPFTIIALVTTGKKVGEYVGRVAVRTIGSFNISTKNGLVQGISHKACKSIHKKDGYSYAF